MAFIKPSEIAHFISKSIWLFCIGYVLYQGLNLIEKYSSRPHVTVLSHEYNKKYGYPTITICSDDGESIYNTTALKKCNISSDEEYYNGLQ